MNPTSDSGQAVAPDSTAVRVALWRAMHVEIDPPPHVLEDEIGLKLVAPQDGWRYFADRADDLRPPRNTENCSSPVAPERRRTVPARSDPVGTSRN
jgi:hypothetical protein